MYSNLNSRFNDRLIRSNINIVQDKNIKYYEKDQIIFQQNLSEIDRAEILRKENENLTELILENLKNTSKSENHHYIKSFDHEFEYKKKKQPKSLLQNQKKYFSSILKGIPKKEYCIKNQYSNTEINYEPIDYKNINFDLDFPVIKEKVSFIKENYCSKCNENGRMMTCSGCNSFYHLKCIGMKRYPTDHFICDKCSKKIISNDIGKLYVLLNVFFQTKESFHNIEIEKFNGKIIFSRDLPSNLIGYEKNTFGKRKK